MAKAKNGRDADLEKLLQAVCDLELWTIPLYLTAAYSIKLPPSTDTKPASLAAWDCFNKILSVAVQEMYHTQLACNLTAFFGLKPKLDTPVFSPRVGIPYIKTPRKIRPLVKLGNARQAVKLMIAIETPDVGTPPDTPQKAYNSIGDVYHVLWGLVEKNLTNSYYFPKQRVQQVESNFETRYAYNTVAASGAQSMLSVIVDQGEGSLDSGSHGPLVDPNVPPSDQPSRGSRFYAYDRQSHYQRFMEVQAALDEYDVKLYSRKKHSRAGKYQKALNVVYSALLGNLRRAWAGRATFGPDFWAPMYVLKYGTAEVWQQGAVPEFRQARYTKKTLNEAMDVLDKYYLAHQSAIDKTLPQHACQGLNQCKSQGHLKSGTKAGDGDCATVFSHTCSGGNDCKDQGGCGYAVSSKQHPNWKNYVPGANDCKSQGGCETPISPEQVFSGGPYDQQSVWDRARTLFAQKVGTLPKVTTNARRKNVVPTSTKKAAAG